jgi:hypothetical protein
MAAGAFYRPVEPEILQGDIFRSVPHLFLKPPLRAVRGPITLSKGRTAYGLYSHPLPGAADPAESPKVGGPFHFDEGEQVSVDCCVTRAIILNHDCYIENEPEHRHVALIRPLRVVTNPDHRQVIQQNRNFSYFHLPPGGGELEEAYVDFRRITSLAPEFLSAQDRLAALTEEAVAALQAQLFRYFTHRVLSLDEPGDRQ